MREAYVALDPSAIFLPMLFLGSATRSRLVRLEVGPSSGWRFDFGGRRPFAFLLAFIAHRMRGNKQNK
jgi:hypothetical protein